MPRYEKSAPRSGPTRCAIYTRKSTEEGLDQEFNSLDAQREACAAFILSQRHEGWTLVPELYDDGGYSGGNIERPGLQRLLADIEAGNIDVIVVYKVDRLTRALSDFARIVETLDAAGASFVSITQAFNTTTSMGRLTLNVLLSFAQFEREVISERVRDKVAASKRKGIWMGGTVPLGYDVQDRRLVINTAEAETVRYIMRRYLEVGSVRDLLDVLGREGLRTKVQRRRDGSIRGGVPFSRGGLYHLLKSPLYIGRMPHRKDSYPGQHEAIVEQPLWRRVQEMLAANAAARRLGTNFAQPSLLSGMLFDNDGKALTASHTRKGSRRYRYYVGAEAESSASRRHRIPAGDIEAQVSAMVIEALAEGALVARFCQATGDSSGLRQVLTSASAAVEVLRTGSTSEAREVLRRLHLKVLLTGAGAELRLDLWQLRESLDQAGGVLALPCVIQVPPLPSKRQGERLIFGLGGSAPAGRADPRLLSLIVKGFAAREELEQEAGLSGAAAARRRAHLSRQARVTYLAPDILEAMISGTCPKRVNARELLKISNLPLSWPEQHRRLAFTSA